MAYKKSTKKMSEMIDEDPIVEEVQEVQDFSYSSGRGGFGKWVAIIIVLAIIIVGGWYLLDKYTDISLPFQSEDLAASSEWQAVFLTNGQVYFGKIKSVSREDVILEDIYYMQVVNKPLQMTQEGEGVAVDDGQTQQELTLVKLGNEIHGPTDKMTINRDHVMLIESLRKDSQVVQAIDAYLEQKANQ